MTSTIWDLLVFHTSFSQLLVDSTVQAAICNLPFVLKDSTHLDGYSSVKFVLLILRNLTVICGTFVNQLKKFRGEIRDITITHLERFFSKICDVRCHYHSPISVNLTCILTSPSFTLRFSSVKSVMSQSLIWRNSSVMRL